MTILLLVGMQPAYADEKLLLAEQKIKAGMLYNFLKYTEWPDSDFSSFSVCIFGDDPFNGDLSAMMERTVNQKRITLHFIKENTQATSCQLLFINKAEHVRWPELLNYLAKQAVLTVSDMRDFARKGGMIEFRRGYNRINVDINMEAVTAAKLKVKDQLLRLTSASKGD